MLKDGDDLTQQEIEGKEGGQYVVAHDGLVLYADPLVNFAAPGSLVSKMYINIHVVYACVYTSGWFEL